MKILTSGWPLLMVLVLLGNVSAQPIIPFDAKSAGKLFDLALAGIDREYPNKPGHVFTSDQDVRPPRELHPVFHGHFDWHSSVHGHWTLVRLLKLFPDHEKASEVRQVLAKNFTENGLLAEAQYLREHKSFERMYGWAWALRLGLELRTWNDEQGRIWSKQFEPVEAAIVANTIEYLPKLDWPIRCGFHPDTSFPFSQMIDYGRATGNFELVKLVLDQCGKYYEHDVAYPVTYEPSGNDFFSSGLNEADLMRRVLPLAEFDQWLTSFFPGLAKGDMGKLLTPVAPKDLEDGHLVHLIGLNLSRAWTMRAIAGSLTRGNDPRKKNPHRSRHPPCRGRIQTGLQRQLRGRTLAGILRGVSAERRRGRDGGRMSTHVPQSPYVHCRERPALLIWSSSALSRATTSG